MLRSLIRSFLPIAAFLSAGSLFAEPIAYEIVFLATGSITYTNGSTQDFNVVEADITVFGNTTLVEPWYSNGILKGYQTYPLPAVIIIPGLGSFTAANFLVGETQEVGLEFLQKTFARVSQTITVQVPNTYNLQGDFTNSAEFNTNYFNAGYIQTNAGQIRFTSTQGTGLVAARLHYPAERSSVQ